jgi:transmembrane sensor
MSAREEQVRSLIEQDAADWFVASRAGLTARERNDLAAWLKASPVHVEEYLALEVIGRDLREACKASQNSIDELLARAQREEDKLVRPFWSRLAEGLRAPSSRWEVAAIAMAALGVVSVGLLVLWNLRPIAHVSTPAEVTVLHFETRHGEQQTHRLVDNSVLHLNTATALTVRYSKRERLVTLTAGEADFEVAHESERPFRVFAGPAEVVDLGTQFDVRLSSDSTVVTVLEGRVAVEPAPLAEGLSIGSKRGQASRSVELGPNQQVAVSRGEWPAVPVAVDAERTTGWLHQQIAFSHEPLERVAAEFNRYVPKPIEITTPELRKLEITGVFATDDPRAFIAFLRSLDGVRVDETATRILVSKK